MQSAKKPWWKEYRRRMHRIPEKIDKERLFRSSMTSTFMDYFANSSLPGMHYFMDQSITKKERLAWIITITVASSVVGLNMYMVWTEVLANPLIVSMESNVYPIDKIDFPAIALCNINRISKKAAREFAESILKPILPKVPIEKLQEFYEQLGKLIDFEAGTSADFISILQSLPASFHSNLNVIDRMKELSPKCEDMLKRCVWGGRVVPCEDIFVTRRTAHGHCCVFNYIMEWNTFGRPLRSLGAPKRQPVPGEWYGLIIVVDPELEDYAYPIHNAEGFDVLIFDSMHYPDHNNGLLIHRISEPNEMITIEIESRTQHATDEVQKYSQQTRKCIFDNELPLEFGSMYTFSSCIIGCRIQTVQSLCKCTPYYLPVTNESTPICTLTNLDCLHKYREKFLYLYPLNAVTTDGLEMEMQDSLYCPQCLPDCEYTRHTTKSTVTSMYTVDKDIPLYILKGLNTTNMCYISIFRPTPDGIIDKLDVVFYWYELLSNFGGAAGLLIGYSVVTSIEIIYFLTIRLFASYIEKLKENLHL